MKEGIIAVTFVVTVFVAGVWVSRKMQYMEAHPKPVHHWGVTEKICHKWKQLENFAHVHRKPFHRAHGLIHASYFGMVFTHGPYNVVAGLLLAVAIAGWLLHLEDR